MVLGSLLLFESPDQIMRVSLSLIAAFTLATATITVTLVRVVVISHKLKVVSGKEGILGEKGKAQSKILPGKQGKIFVHGEIWNAVSREKINKGESVEVVNIDGMTLEVKRV